MEKDINEKIALLGVRQFVRSRLLKALMEAEGTKDSDNVAEKINIDMMIEFQEIAKDEVKKTLKEATELIKKND